MSATKNVFTPNFDAPLSVKPPPRPDPPNDADLIATLAHKVREQQVEIDDLKRQAQPYLDDPQDLGLRFQSLDEFIQRPRVASLVRGVIPANSIVVCYGPPKGGKTHSFCDLTMHAAHGMDWNGCKVSRALRIAYLIGEGVTGLRVRLKAWLEYHDSVTEKGAFIILPRPVSLPDQVLEVVEKLREFAPDIVVTDTLNAFFGGGDENSTQDMTKFCEAIRILRDELHTSVVIIHHSGHGAEGRERGSIVLRASADVLIQVAKDEGAGELVGFQVVAARDIEPMQEPISLRLRRHTTEWKDEDGEALITCVVQPGNMPVTLPGRGGKPLGPAQKQLLHIIQELAKGKPVEPSGEVMLARHDVVEVAKAQGMKKQSISSAWPSLSERKLIRLVEPGTVFIAVRTK